MEPKHYLIDTNSVIDYLGKKFPDSGMKFMHSVIDSVPNISVITKIEVLGFNAPEEHYRLLLSFMDDSMVIDLTTEIVDHCIVLRKSTRTKLPDAIIAATAIVNKLTLITNNKSDFKNIDGLKIINAHDM